MTEHQNEYFTDQLVRFPYYGPQGRTVTSNGMTIMIESNDGPAPCSACGGAMEDDIVLGDLEQCATCGCRRMVPKRAAAASGRDALRVLFEELLTDLQSTWLAASASNSDREIIQVDIDDYRARLAALLGKG